MKVRYALLSLALCATQIQAQGISYNEESVDLKALYQEIDEAIPQMPQYVAERERKIAVCRDSLLKEDNLEKRALTAEQLFRLYKSYKNDSAQYSSGSISPTRTTRLNIMLSYVSAFRRRWDVLTSLGVIVRCLPYSARTRIWWQSR